MAWLELKSQLFTLPGSGADPSDPDPVGLGRPPNDLAVELTRGGSVSFGGPGGGGGGGGCEIVNGADARAATAVAHAPLQVAIER